MEKRMGIFTPKNLTALDSNHMIAQQNYFGWLFVCLLLWQKNNPSSNVESPSVYVVQLNLFLPQLACFLKQNMETGQEPLD